MENSRDRFAEALPNLFAGGALQVMFDIRFEPPFIGANVAIAAPFLFFAFVALKQFHPVVRQRRSRGAREATRRV